MSSLSIISGSSTESILKKEENPNDTTEQLINMIVNTENNDSFINIIMKKVELLEKEGFSFRKPTL